MKSTIIDENHAKEHVSLNPDSNVKVVDNDLFNTYEYKLSYPSMETASSDESQETSEEISTQEAEYLRKQYEPKVFVKLKQEEYEPNNDYSEISVELKEALDEEVHNHHLEAQQGTTEIAIDDTLAPCSESNNTVTIGIPTETLTTTTSIEEVASTKKKDNTSQAPFYYIVISSDEEDEVEVTDIDCKDDEETKDNKDNDISNDSDTKDDESEDDVDKLFHYDDYHDLLRGLSFTPEPQPPKYNFDDENFDAEAELDRLYEAANRKPEIIVLSDDDEDDIVVKQEKNDDFQPLKSSYKFQYSEKREAEDDDDFQEMLQLPASTQKRLKSSSMAFT